MPTTSPDNIFYEDGTVQYGDATNAAMQATSIQNALNLRQGYNFVWANAAARTAQTGMVQGSTGYQVDTKTLYSYDNSAWRLQVSHAVFDTPSTNITSGVDSACGIFTYNSGLSTDNTFVTSDGATSGLLTATLPGIYAIGSITIFNSNTTTTAAFRTGTIVSVPYYQIQSTTGRASFLSVPNVRVTAANTQLWFTCSHSLGSTQGETTQIRITRIA